MPTTPSGDYSLPPRFRAFLGNAFLRLAYLVPTPLATKLVARHEFYQVFDGNCSAGQQGDSAKKWQALGLPQDLTGKSLLDIGCAEGFFCLQAVSHGAAEVFGVDVGLGALFCAQLLAHERRAHVHYRVAAFPRDMPKKTFDYVLCLSVLHHFVSTKNIWRVLTDPRCSKDKAMLTRLFAALAFYTTHGGTCVVEMPYEYDSPSERQEVDYDLLAQQMCQEGFRSVSTLGSWECADEYKTSKDRVIYWASR